MIAILKSRKANVKARARPPCDGLPVIPRAPGKPCCREGRAPAASSGGLFPLHEEGEEATGREGGPIGGGRDSGRAPPRNPRVDRAHPPQTDALSPSPAC